MVRSPKVLSLGTWLVACGCAGSAVAADDERVKQDLTAVIALQGKPCGQVVRFERRAESDYLVSCEDGNRYRVFVSAAGRVVVEQR